MDRPILLTNLYHDLTPLLGVKVVEAPDPRTLTERCQAEIDLAANAGYSSAFLQGFELAGAGGGDSCRAILTLTRNLGWGLMTAIPAILARVIFRRASHSREITSVLEQMYAAIAADADHSPFVWQPRIVGTGRDGSYLIGLAWCDGNPGSLVLNVEAFPSTGIVTAATTVCSLVVPQTVDGTVDTDSSWHITWGMICEDNTGSGCKCRLEMDGAPLWEAEEVGGANLWQDHFGQYNHTQSPTGITTFDLIVEPTVPGLGVQARGSSLRAALANYPNNPS